MERRSKNRIGKNEREGGDRERMIKRGLLLKDDIAEWMDTTILHSNSNHMWTANLPSIPLLSFLQLHALLSSLSIQYSSNYIHHYWYNHYEPLSVLSI